MAEITGLLDLWLWPRWSQVLVCREEPHPGVNYNVLDPRGLAHHASFPESQDSDIADP